MGCLRTGQAPAGKGRPLIPAPLRKAFAAALHSQPERVLLIFQSVLAAVAITPFGLWRLWHGETAQGLFDVGLVCALMALAYLAREIPWQRPISRAVAVIYVAASLVVTHAFGPLGQLWFFPAMVAAFFVLRSGEAFAVSLVGILLQLSMATAQDAWNARTSTFAATSLLVCFFIYAFSTRLRQDNNRLYTDSTIDSLTGAGNRRLLDDTLAGLRPATANAPTTLLMFDIDHFKTVNDRFGHATGDLCLQRLADRVRQRLGPSGKFYRYGGEEFVALLDMPANAAVALADTLREDIAASTLIRDGQITVSIGVAVRKPDEPVRDWVRRADDAMYAAKGAGRNRVRLAA